MEPIPETSRAIDELDPLDDADDDLLERLLATGNRVRDVVPQCVGLSLTLRKHGVTLTLVASDAEIAALDAVQYVAGGPCVDAVDETEVVAVDCDTMDEQGWHLFADATAARGVASTLSMPVLDADRVVGGVNLYGSTADAFDGHHLALAEILGTWAQGAVTNADLSFSTLEAARRAPQQLRDHTTVDVAVGLLSAFLRIDLDQARDRLTGSAARAGSDLIAVAALVVDLLGGRSS